MSPDDEYTYQDIPPVTNGVLYYRMRQNFKDGRFVLHDITAIKLKNEKRLAIENISPIPFINQLDISYISPAAGRVWLQLTDNNGKIKSTESCEASQGKNIHVFKGIANLESGSYNLNLIFGDKKVSCKVVKG
jgi:hypothetical protein